jgi:hypothetical protein
VTCSKSLYYFPVQYLSLSKSELYYDRQSVGQSVLVLGTHLCPVTSFSFSSKFSIDSCGFVICNLLLLLVLASAVPWDSRPYFIVPILETPPTWRDRSPIYHAFHALVIFLRNNKICLHVLVQVSMTGWTVWQKNACDKIMAHIGKTLETCFQRGLLGFK